MSDDEHTVGTRQTGERARRSAQKSTVIDALLARRQAGSRPGSRSDGLKIALAIEGGGNRAAYSAGMALALDEAGLTDCFDDIYGTSGGALNAAWLLTGEAQQWLRSWAWRDVVAAGVVDPRRALRGGVVLDLNLLVGHVYEQITPMRFDAILANPIDFHPIATLTATGAPVDLGPLIKDRASLQVALRASSAMPLLAGRPVEMEGRHYLDGGLSEAVPYRSALEQGASHVLVLRTRRSDQAPKLSRVERALLAPYFIRHGRAAGRSHRERVASHHLDEQQLASVANVQQIRPPLGAPDVSRLRGDLATIDKALDIGYDALQAALSESTGRSG